MFMRSLGLISMYLLLLEGYVVGQQAEPTVALKLNRPEQIASPTAATLQAKVVNLLKTSNFNSKDHPGPVFPGGAKGVQRRYRDTVGGQYLVVGFPQPQQLELIRGQVTAIEVIVGLNNPQNADALFTVDPNGRVVEHSKFSGKLATELLDLVKGTDAQIASQLPDFAPGKYCCKTPETGYVGCIIFKSDGSYEATAKFRDQEGTACGTWNWIGKQIVLSPQMETGSLVGYLTRFSIDDDTGKSLTWLPKSRQDFSRSGGAVVYPRYEKSDEKGI
jgi:hypothetical protein